MDWIVLSLIYALTNALYTTYNDKRHFNGYVLGIWRGFGISAITAPLLTTVPFDIITPVYLLVLILQGIMIGIYDSRIFFASAKFGGRSSSGFMATTVLLTVFLWWGIDFSELAALMKNPPYLISLMLVLAGFSISYWQMMKVHISSEAEKYLYPAVFALSLMSIATRYIAIHGGSAYAGVIWYLTVSCFVSGVYNVMLFYFSGGCKTEILAPVFRCQGVWLIVLSIILITAKTLALRIALNPGYVIALLLLSPILAQAMETKCMHLTRASILTISFLGLLLILTA